MDEAGQVTDYSHVKKHMRDVDLLLSEIYNWQCRAINGGYDIPDREYDHLLDINFRLSEPPNVSAHVGSLVLDINYQEELLNLIEMTHPKIFQRAVNAYSARKILKGDSND